jgi:4-hydroxy-tetrahydrodipicolinate reductase
MRVVVVGAGGRMGGEVCRLLAGQADIELVGGVEAAGHRLVGSELGKTRVVTDLARIIDQTDIVVDFSAPAAVVADALVAAGAGKAFVSGVTGLLENQTEALCDCARRIPVVHAANFSLGVSALCRLVAEAARLLGPGFDVEIVETHHRKKQDAPSGTAARLVQVVKRSAGRHRTVYGREGMVGAKPVDEIGVSSIRTGDVVGDHTVIFGGEGERLELTHRATSRLAFACGVLAAIRFVKDRKPGFYSMDDVLAASS